MIIFYRRTGSPDFAGLKEPQLRQINYEMMTMQPGFYTTDRYPAKEEVALLEKMGISILIVGQNVKESDYATVSLPL